MSGRTIEESYTSATTTSNMRSDFQTRRNGYEETTALMLRRLGIPKPVTAAQARRYGCHNHAPFVDMVHIKTQVVVESGQTMEVRRSYPFVATRDCQYTKTELGQVDKGCAGCKHKEVAR